GPGAAPARLLRLVLGLVVVADAGDDLAHVARLEGDNARDARKEVLPERGEVVAVRSGETDARHHDAGKVRRPPGPSVHGRSTYPEGWGSRSETFAEARDRGPPYIAPAIARAFPSAFSSFGFGCSTRPGAVRAFATISATSRTSTSSSLF